MHRKGYFITFEGPEGCGKSTQLKALARFLRRRGFAVVTTREPGGTELGQLIRKVMLNSKTPIHPLGELFLFSADRVQHVQEVILPNLAKECIVLSDRYVDSTFAYQVGGRKLPLARVRALNDWSTQGVTPDLTFLLDINAKTGLTRAGQRRRRLGKDRLKDRFEASSLTFHEAVRKAYRDRMREMPERFIYLQTESSFAEGAKKIRDEVMVHLSKKFAKR